MKAYSDLAGDIEQVMIQEISFVCLAWQHCSFYVPADKINHISKEEIHLVTCKTIELSQLPYQVPDDAARYHLYNFKHTFEGDYMESIVFIYSMPGYSCSIKERMLYSSCKAPFIVTIENTGLKIEKKIEIDSGKELTEEFLMDEIHPKKHLHRPKFDKPKGPPNRGAKRITKPQS